MARCKHGVVHSGWHDCDICYAEFMEKYRQQEKEKEKILKDFEEVRKKLPKVYPGSRGKRK